MNLSSRRTLLGIGVSGLVALMLVGASGTALYFAARDATTAFTKYQHERARLSADLRQAEQQGYTTSDLRPITAGVSSMDHAFAPLWFPERVTFYKRQTAEADRLDASLKSLEQQVLGDAQAQLTDQTTQAKTSISHAREIGAIDSDVNPLQQRLDEITRAQSGPQTIADTRASIGQAKTLGSDIATLVAAQEIESQALKQAADGLKAQTGANLDAIHNAGSGALAAGRNYASIAAYMNKPSPFNGFDALNRAYNRLEHYAPNIGSGDVDQAALAAAAAQRYSGQIHDSLIAGLPSKAIVVSYTLQELWAYENGKVVQDTLVTTGRPELPTDIGPMKVLWRSSPWTMHSPWPKGSPFYYPDTVVKMVLWFTPTGEGLHDASWQPDGTYGPGSEMNGNLASHGCIHVPFGSEQFLFNWASNGTPVIVYLGDGSPVSNQISRITTDDHGNPQTGPKGA